MSVPTLTGVSTAESSAVSIDASGYGSTATYDIPASGSAIVNANVRFAKSTVFGAGPYSSTATITCSDNPL